MTHHAADDTAGRTAELFHQRQYANWVRTDRLFAGLLLFEWAAAIVVALWVSPRTWQGSLSQTHIHVYAAIFLGALLAGFPAALALLHPGRASTRYTIAVAQMLWSALLIHLTGGRIETHFHVFGSLAFLAFYRDWRVFVPATTVVIIDHVFRGIFWPQSVYGVLTASPFRSIEHAAWVAFIDFFLINSCRQSVREMWDFARDHVELQQAKELIEDRESRLRSLSTASPVGIYEVDLAGNLTYFNERWTEVLGDNPRVHPQDLERARNATHQALSEHEDGKVEVRLLEGDDDEVRWMEARWRIKRSADGRATGVVGTAADVTKQKTTETELEETRDQALEASRLKSEFVANMSHEIRTPMNAVIGMSGLLETTALNDEQRDYVETIRTSGEALLSLINDILDFSKIEAARVELESQPFDVRTCVEEAIDLVAPNVGGKPIEMAFSFNEIVPVGVVGDVTRLRQILVNLLSNAVKFTEKGEIVVSVDAVRQGSTNWQLSFAVRDTGIGIPADRTNRLFQLFSQTDASTTRRYGGTGLGLAISKRFAELMGGTMWVESEEGQGSTFNFTIDVPEAIGFEPALEDEDATILNGRRVLIVDDNETSRNILSAQTRSMGLEPLVMASPAEALEWARTGERVDFALLDMHMPEMDGLELGAELQKLHHETKLTLVLLSSVAIAREGSGSRKEELQRFDAILTKPAKLVQLRSALVQLANGRSTRAKRRRRGLDGGAGERNPLRILLAEDNHINQKVAVRILAQMGYRADVAANGLETLEALERQSYDLVLMDVQMPEMNGIDAASEICRRYPEQRRPHIIAMTANAMEEDRKKCLAAGMNDFLPKPVAPHALAAALERCTRKAEASEAPSPEPGAP